MFWDSSSLIPLILPEARSTELTAAFDADSHPVTWWAAPVECHSAVSRLVRDHRITLEEARLATDRLRSVRSRTNEMAPSDDIRARAIDVLGTHGLRAADALQLASALAWCEGRPRGETFTCADLRLRDAARQEGFRLLPVK
jgi:predicted nucleic acid-binding protein